MAKYWMVLIVLFLAVVAHADDKEQKQTPKSDSLENAEAVEAKIATRMQKTITVTLTHNPKKKPLTLGYALYRILKEAKVKYLRKETNAQMEDDQLDNIDTMKINQIKAHGMPVKSLIRAIAGSRGLDYTITAKGVFFHKKAREKRDIEALIRRREAQKQKELELAKQKAAEKAEEKEEKKVEAKKKTKPKPKRRRRVVRRRSGY